MSIDVGISARIGRSCRERIEDRVHSGLVVLLISMISMLILHHPAPDVVVIETPARFSSSLRPQSTDLRLARVETK